MRRPIAILMTVLVAATISCASLGSPSPEPLQTTAAPTATPTLTPTPDAPPSDCPHMPLGGFNDVWRDQQVYPRLGCAVAPAEIATGTEVYLCNGIHTLWLSEQRLFAVIPAWPYSWRFIADESNLPEDVPLMEEPISRSQLCFPVSGRHDWLVRGLNSDREEELWAKTSETTFNGVIQQFERGWLLWNGNVCFVLFEDGTWTMF
jgi:hypothetical protein